MNRFSIRASVTDVSRVTYGERKHSAAFLATFAASLTAFAAFEAEKSSATVSC